MQKEHYDVVQSLCLISEVKLPWEEFYFIEPVAISVMTQRKCMCLEFSEKCIAFSKASFK